MTAGKFIVIGLAVLAVLFGAGLWWFQTQAYYRSVDGLMGVEAQGRFVPIVGYRGIDADSSPLKMRGCFRVDPATLADLAEAESPTPLIAPGWFSCFDAEAIGADLEAGRARAAVAARDEPEGFDRIIAWYPDGRAFQWRQLREE